MTLPLTPEERRDLLLSVGTHRGERRLSPIEVARLFDKAMKGGATLSQCAHAAGFAGPEMVRRFQRLLNLPPSLQPAVSWRGSDTTIPFTAAAEIARLPDSVHETVGREVLARGLSSSEVKQAVQRMMRGNRDPAQAIGEILALRPRVVRRHVFIGTFSDADLSERIKQLDERYRGDLLAAALRPWLAPQGAAMRLTPSGFVITGDDETANTIAGLGDFEAVISLAVAKQLQST